MAIKIGERKPEIPVEIGPLQVWFNVTDESSLEFRKNGLQIQKELENLQIDEENEDDIKVVKDILKRGFDLMLGEGAFEQLYELTPSVVLLMDYFAQLSAGIAGELEKMGAPDVLKRRAERYIGKKKK